MTTVLAKQARGRGVHATADLTMALRQPNANYRAFGGRLDGNFDLVDLQNPAVSFRLTIERWNGSAWAVLSQTVDVGKVGRTTQPYVSGESVVPTARAAATEQLRGTIELLTDVAGTVGGTLEVA